MESKENYFVFWSLKLKQLVGILYTTVCNGSYVYLKSWHTYGITYSPTLINGHLIVRLRSGMVQTCVTDIIWWTPADSVNYLYTFQISFNLIGKSTMALLTGQSWWMLESWYTVGAKNKDCRTVSQTDSTKSLVPSVPQAIMLHVPGT